MATRSTRTGTLLAELRNATPDAPAFNTWTLLWETRLAGEQFLPMPPSPTTSGLSTWRAFAQSYDNVGPGEAASIDGWFLLLDETFAVSAPADVEPPDKAIEREVSLTPEEQAAKDANFQVLSAVATGSMWGAALYILVRVLPGAIKAGVRVSWTRLPGWARTGLVAVGLAEGVDIVIDNFIDPDPGSALDVIEQLTPDILPFLHDDDTVVTPGGSQLALPPGDMGFAGVRVADGTVIVNGSRTHEIVSAWPANGVWFYRSSARWLGTREKTGGWKWWFPRGGVVLNKVGGNDSANILAALRIIEKEEKTARKILKALGYKAVRRTSDAK